MSGVRRDGHCRRHHAALDEVQAYAEPQQNRQEQNARPVPAPTLHGVANMTTSAAISKPIQTFWWRGQQIACGTMLLAALEALIAGVRVRCELDQRVMARLEREAARDSGERYASWSRPWPSPLTS
jgi:hypothetical protein